MEAILVLSAAAAVLLVFCAGFGAGSLWAARAWRNSLVSSNARRVLVEREGSR